MFSLFSLLGPQNYAGYGKNMQMPQAQMLHHQQQQSLLSTPHQLHNSSQYNAAYLLNQMNPNQDQSTNPSGNQFYNENGQKTNEIQDETGANNNDNQTVNKSLRSKFPLKQDSEFYFDSGSSTGPISSSSSTNNDSLSSNVSSSESDCESKPILNKKSNLSALTQLPPSSSSSVNGDDYQNDASSNQIQINFKKFTAAKRKPYRSSSNSVNINDETIKSSINYQSVSSHNNRKFGANAHHHNHHQQHTGHKKNQFTKQNTFSGHFSHGAAANSSAQKNGANKFNLEHDSDSISSYPVLVSLVADKRNESFHEPK